MKMKYRANKQILSTRQELLDDQHQHLIQLLQVETRRQKEPITTATTTISTTTAAASANATITDHLDAQSISKSAAATNMKIVNANLNHVSGLNNLGNTCFFNSILQVKSALFPKRMCNFLLLTICILVIQ